MEVNLKGRYFEKAIDVTQDLLKLMWEKPWEVGGGAERFRINGGGSCWKTKEGWGFVRDGSKGFGKVRFVDPMPGRGQWGDACSPNAFQYEGQRPYPHGTTIFVGE